MKAPILGTQLFFLSRGPLDWGSPERACVHYKHTPKRPLSIYIYIFFFFLLRMRRQTRAASGPLRFLREKDEDGNEINLQDPDVLKSKLLVGPRKFARAPLRQTDLGFRKVFLKCVFATHADRQASGPRGPQIR